MAEHDVNAVMAFRDELGNQLDQGAMRAAWASPGGLDDLMDFHGVEFNVGGAIDFLQRRLTCAGHLQDVLRERLEGLGYTDGQDDRQIFTEIRQEEWKSERGHLPNRARFVLNFLDEQQKRGRVSMLTALSELVEVLESLMLRFARIREGSAANDTPTIPEDTGPPEPRVHRLKSSTANC